MSQPPEQPKIYHIIHWDKLRSIVVDGFLFSDATMANRRNVGTTIGIQNIKQRRLNSQLDSRPGLRVGDCVPFYWSARSVMLYLFWKNNHPNLTYHGGQEPIIHLEADLHATIEWAERNAKRWAFTLSNVGSEYFDDRCDLNELNEINWEAVQARIWRGDQESKQAEFLLEERFPWELVERIGVYSQATALQVDQAMAGVAHRPPMEILRDWYYY